MRSVSKSVASSSTIVGSQVGDTTYQRGLAARASTEVRTTVMLIGDGKDRG